MSTSLSMLEASGAAASMFFHGANPGDFGGNVRVAVQKIWQRTELSFKLPHVNVLVIQVVNFRTDQYSIIYSRISRSDHESRVW